MNSSPFTLRSDQDLLATFRDRDQKAVVLPQQAPYPMPIQHYYAWSESSGTYTYIVFKRPDWETPLGLVFQRNVSGSTNSPSGMCEWCHHMGPSNEVGLMTTQVTSNLSGGTWLCLDLSCLSKIESLSGFAARNSDKLTQKLVKRIGEFYQRVRVEHE